MTLHREFRDEIEALSLRQRGVLLLLCLERLVHYHERYYLDHPRMRQHSHGVMEMLDRGWCWAAGDPLGVAPPHDFQDGDEPAEPSDAWGGWVELIAALVWSLVERLVEKGAPTMSDVREVLDEFDALQEAADDGFLVGPPGWGPVERQRDDLRSDLGAARTAAPRELSALRFRVRADPPPARLISPLGA